MSHKIDPSSLRGKKLRISLNKRDFFFSNVSRETLQKQLQRGLGFFLVDNKHIEAKLPLGLIYDSL